ncbi:MAG: hypothetical protein JXP73_14280 [Deltaproteobacteria bacterium]|nr:hypothetical protein [Deltaproteobacteria bacterium]
MEKDDLLPILSLARQELSEAERELDKALGEIRVALRAEKIGISIVVEDAFARLRRAKSRLVAIEARLSSSDE